jgi:two-component system, response regulator / RNA-binding antiterminator
VKTGAAAYVIDCNDPERLCSFIGVARARLNERQCKKKELLETRTAMQVRKSVEKTKGIIMQTKNLGEEQAYSTMCKLVMNHNKRIGEISQQIVFAAQVLV